MSGSKKKDVQKVWQHILDSIDFISSYISVFIQRGGQTHKKKREGSNHFALGDSGTLALGYWLRSLIYKLIVATYFPVHPVSSSLIDNNFFEINQMLKYFVIADAEG